MKFQFFGSKGVAAVFVLVLCNVGAFARTPLPSGNTPDDLSPAAYCVAKGGEVENRDPYYNTNDDPKNWLRLTGSRRFCQFTLKSDGSRIHILLSTLYSEKPSLAALAYYVKVRLDKGAMGIRRRATARSWAAPTYLAGST